MQVESKKAKIKEAESRMVAPGMEAERWGDTGKNIQFQL